MPSEDELPPPHRHFLQWNKKMHRTAIALLVADADRPQFGDALKFFERVKARFEGQPNAFGEFLSIVKSCKEGDVPPMEANSKMAKLFMNHLDWYADFKLILPFEPPELPEEKTPPQFADAFKFVEKVRARFEANSQAYGEFLSTLKRFKEGNVPAMEVCTKMAGHFRNNQDLYEDFKFFLPPRFKPPKLPEEKKEEEAADLDTNSDPAD